MKRILPFVRSRLYKIYDDTQATIHKPKRLATHNRIHTWSTLDKRISLVAFRAATNRLVILYVTERTATTRVLQKTRTHALLIMAAQMERTIVVRNAFGHGRWNRYVRSCERKWRGISTNLIDTRRSILSPPLTISALEMRISDVMRRARAHGMMIMCLAQRVPTTRIDTTRLHATAAHTAGCLRTL